MIFWQKIGIWLLFVQTKFEDHKFLGLRYAQNNDPPKSLFGRVFQAFCVRLEWKLTEQYSVTLLINKPKMLMRSSCETPKYLSLMIILNLMYVFLQISCQQSFDLTFYLFCNYLWLQRIIFQTVKNLLFLRLSWSF